MILYHVHFVMEMDSLFIKVKNVSVQNVVDVELERKKKTAIKYNVHRIEWKVSSIKLTINKDNDPIVVYKLIGFDNWCNVAIKETADEKHLFATHEDAKKYCDEKNNQLKD